MGPAKQKPLDVAELRRRTENIRQMAQRLAAQSDALAARNRELCDSAKAHLLELRSGISAARGHAREARRIQSEMFKVIPAREPEPAPHLTNREREVLRMIVQGYSSKQIALELGVSFKTATTHRAHLMEKFGVREMASLVRLAIQYRVVSI
jgi:DNA-binding NarL/FixJ family response regulator